MSLENYTPLDLLEVVLGEWHMALPFKQRPKEVKLSREKRAELREKILARWPEPRDNAWLAGELGRQAFIEAIQEMGLA